MPGSRAGLCVMHNCALQTIKLIPFVTSAGIGLVLLRMPGPRINLVCASFQSEEIPLYIITATPPSLRTSSKKISWVLNTFLFFSPTLLFLSGFSFSLVLFSPHLSFVVVDIFVSSLVFVPTIPLLSSLFFPCLFIFPILSPYSQL